MTDPIAAALAAGLQTPEIELKPWDTIPAEERAHLRSAIVSSNPPRFLIAPQTQNGLAATLATANAEGLWTLPYGRGTKLDWGGTIKEIDLLASTRNLNRIVEHAVGDLTITVEAGATLADIQRQLAAHQQFLPIDPAFPKIATIGGILATADTGSWRQRYGSVRDLVLGISIVRADGQMAKAGGRVVKNVAGYDLMKLMVGSYGTLGAIAQVTLRTYAVAEASATALATGDAAALAAVTSQLRDSTLTPVAADILTPTALADSLASATDAASGGSSSASFGAIARFQGATAGVKEQLVRFEALAARCGLTTSLYRDRDEQDLWERVRMVARPPAAAAVCKFGLKPAAAVELLAKLADAAGIVHLGSGLGRACVAARPEFVTELRTFCESHGGYLTILTADRAFKTQQLEPWGYRGNTLEIMRRLKRRFDPQNILSPGRFVGSL